MVWHDRVQRPPQAPAGELPFRLRSSVGVLPPHPSAAGAFVATHPDQQHRGTLLERLMREVPRNGVA